MSVEPTVWYASKVDLWIGAGMCIPPAASVASIASLAWAGAAALPSAVLSTALVVGVYGGLVLPMKYGITDTEIVVRHGLVRQRIPLADITEVRPTSNPLSAPALSLDRLRIQFGEGFFKSAMISPRDKGRFLDELAAKAGLRREGDRLVRPT
jgi:hypothetical protein